jgi:hypothetical protein
MRRGRLVFALGDAHRRDADAVARLHAARASTRPLFTRTSPLRSTR